MARDIFINIIASLIIGFLVWLWGKARLRRTLNRKSSFFKLKPQDRCLIVINTHPKSSSKSMSIRDIHALVDLLKIVHEIQVEATVAHFDEVLEYPGKVTEFCIGGWESNMRTRVHIKNYLKGIKTRRYNPEDADSIAIITKTGKFRYESGNKEYAILAKFYPLQNSQPIFLIGGQTGITTRAAIHYLSENYDTSLRKKYGEKPFCLIIRVISAHEYGHKGAEIAEDVTAIAFP